MSDMLASLAGRDGKRSAGFTLMTLIIVVAVLSVVVAVAAAILRSKAIITTNERAAIATLRTLDAVEEYYKSNVGLGNYTGLAGLYDCTPPYIDSVLSSGVKNGYSFVGATDRGVNFTFDASPLVVGKTGVRRFFIDSSGTIQENASGDAVWRPHPWFP